MIKLVHICLEFGSTLRKDEFCVPVFNKITKKTETSASVTNSTFKSSLNSHVFINED